MLAALMYSKPLAGIVALSTWLPMHEKVSKVRGFVPVHGLGITKSTLICWRLVVVVVVVFLQVDILLEGGNVFVFNPLRTIVTHS